MSPTVFFNPKTIGFVINPLLYLLTLHTSCTCFSIVLLQCITPIPPSKAKAMANSDSVTVSIGELTTGDLRIIFEENLLFKSTSSGLKSMYPGSKIRSL